MRITNNHLTIILAFLLLLPLMSIFGSCSNQQPFTIQVIPAEINGESIMGQTCVFLVTVTYSRTTNSSGEDVQISAIAEGADVTVVNASIVSNQVAEVHVIPNQSVVGGTVNMTVTGEQGDHKDSKTVSFNIVEGEDSREDRAQEIRDRFVSWLADNHSELGIDNDTVWTGTIVSPQWLVVEHYLFFSEQWEMHVSWHVMIEPHDWAQVNLRHRFTEEKPSCAFKISSWAGDDDPVVVEPESSVWR